MHHKSWKNMPIQKDEFSIGNGGVSKGGSLQPTEVRATCQDDKNVAAKEARDMQIAICGLPLAIKTKRTHFRNQGAWCTP